MYIVLSQVANEVIEELNLRPEDVYLGQGTLRPDLIESASSLASSKADAIKTHHNDTDLVRELRKQVQKKLLRVATVREKYLENEIFSRSGKRQGILWMVREI